jgi:hypothetical protein
MTTTTTTTTITNKQTNKQTTGYEVKGKNSQPFILYG